MPQLRKLPECQQCQFNARSPYVVCAVHPSGCIEDSCIDFKEGDSHENEPIWVPEGYVYCGAETIYSPFANHSQTEQDSVLNTHPLFTGVCPQCGHVFTESPLAHWDCQACHWKDDSI